MHQLAMTTKLNDDVSKIKIELEIDNKISSLLAHDSLYHFVKTMWPIIEPQTPFVDGWHIRSICEHLEYVSEFRLKKLNINMPPRHMKSIIVSVMWPAWVWGTRPHLSFIFGSNAASLATRDSIKCRAVINSPQFGVIFPKWGRGEVSLAADQDQKTIFKNTQGGVRKAVGVGSTVTGEGADFLVVDDPIDAQEAHSELARETAKTWWDTVLSTRINNPKRHAKVIVMQRLHEGDLSGHVMKTDAEFKHLILSARYNPKAELKTNTGFVDPRTQNGQLLWPEQWDADSIRDAEERLGDDAPAQLDQEPKTPGGGFFPKDYWKYYVTSPSPILETVLFIDAAQKPGVSNDFSVFATWARTTNGYYLLDIIREKTDGPLLEELTIQSYNKWKHTEVVIEDKSAGSSLIQYLLVNTSIPVLPFNPGRLSKEVRAAAAKPTVKAGRCFLPSKPIYGTEAGKEIDLVKKFVEEHEKFLKCEHDDTVDTTSMMVKHFNVISVSKPGVRSLV